MCAPRQVAERRRRTAIRGRSDTTRSRTSGPLAASTGDSGTTEGSDTTSETGAPEPLPCGGLRTYTNDATSGFRLEPVADYARTVVGEAVALQLQARGAKGVRIRDVRLSAHE